MSGHRTVSAFLAALGGLAVGFGGLVILEASTSNVDATGSGDVELTSTMPLVTDQPSTTTTAPETVPPTPPSTTSPTTVMPSTTTTSSITTTTTTTTSTTTTTTNPEIGPPTPPSTTSTSTTTSSTTSAPSQWGTLDGATTTTLAGSCGVDDILELVRDGLNSLITGESLDLVSGTRCNFRVEPKRQGDPRCPLQTERDHIHAVLISEGDVFLFLTCGTSATPQTIDEGSP